jgi:2-C-methyl-D-erythritol 4-phosphate cytidylyltransferase
VSARAAPGARVTVVIPAGGVGARLGRRTPKQFLRLDSAPILAVTVGEFARHPAIGAIVVAAPREHLALACRLVAAVATRRPIAVVEGGATRQESVWLALQAVPMETEIVLVHDAVRPFVPRWLIDAVLRATDADGAAICALPIAETVKRVGAGRVEATVDRSGLWTVQTPQGFRAALLREAHDKARRDGVTGTDDAMLVERLGHRVSVVRGSEANLKITTPEDLRRARRVPH